MTSAPHARCPSTSVGISKNVDLSSYTGQSGSGRHDPHFALSYANAAPSPDPNSYPNNSAPEHSAGPALAAGSGSDLDASWAAPAVDSTHGAATSFNLQSSPSGVYAWTMVANVTSPHVLSGLPAGTAIDVQVQSANASGTSPWSATTTLTTASRDTEHSSRPVTGSRSRQRPHRELDSPNCRQRAQRRDYLQPAVQSLRRQSPGRKRRTSAAHIPVGPGRWRGDRRPDPERERCRHRRMVVDQHIDHGLRTVCAECPVDHRRRTAIGRQQRQAHRHLDRTGIRRHARRRDRLYPALRSLRYRYLDDGVRRRQSLHHQRPDRRDRDRRRSPGHQRRGRPRYVVRHRHRRDLGCYRGAGNLDGCRYAGPQHQRRTERRGEYDRDCCANRGDRRRLRLVREPVDTSDYQPDRGQCRRPDQWMGAYFTAPATPGTYYLWLLAQGSGGVTIGALVSSAITVS